MVWVRVWVMVRVRAFGIKNGLSLYPFLSLFLFLLSSLPSLLSPSLSLLIIFLPSHSFF